MSEFFFTIKEARHFFGFLKSAETFDNVEIDPSPFIVSKTESTLFEKQSKARWKFWAHLKLVSVHWFENS